MTRMHCIDSIGFTGPDHIMIAWEGEKKSCNVGDAINQQAESVDFVDERSVKIMPLTCLTSWPCILERNKSLRLLWYPEHCTVENVLLNRILSKCRKFIEAWIRKFCPKEKVRGRVMIECFWVSLLYFQYRPSCYFVAPCKDGNTKMLRCWEVELLSWKK